jgi:hypothetical protein
MGKWSGQLQPAILGQPLMLLLLQEKEAGRSSER